MVEQHQPPPYPLQRPKHQEELRRLSYEARPVRPVPGARPVKKQRVYPVLKKQDQQQKASF